MSILRVRKNYSLLPEHHQIGKLISISNPMLKNGLDQQVEQFKKAVEQYFEIESMTMTYKNIKQGIPLNGLNITTERGKESSRYMDEGLKIFEETYPKTILIKTNQDNPISFDGFTTQAGTLTGIFEFKARDCEKSEFETTYNNDWLITFQKIIDCQSIAQCLRVPLWGFLYLIPSKTLGLIKIWCPDNGWCNFYVSKTKTQKTVDGGVIIRDNAYISMNSAYWIK